MANTYTKTNDSSTNHVSEFYCQSSDGLVDAFATKQGEYLWKISLLGFYSKTALDETMAEISKHCLKFTGKNSFEGGFEGFVMVDLNEIICTNSDYFTISRLVCESFGSIFFIALLEENFIMRVALDARHLPEKNVGCFKNEERALLKYSMLIDDQQEYGFQLELLARQESKPDGSYVFMHNERKIKGKHIPTPPNGSENIRLDLLNGNILCLSLKGAVGLTETNLAAQLTSSFLETVNSSNLFLIVDLSLVTDIKKEARKAYSELEERFSGNFIYTCYAIKGSTAAVSKLLRVLSSKHPGQTGTTANVKQALSRILEKEQVYKPAGSLLEDMEGYLGNIGRYSKEELILLLEETLQKLSEEKKSGQRKQADLLKKLEQIANETDNAQTFIVEENDPFYVLFQTAGQIQKKMLEMRNSLKEQTDTFEKRLFERSAEIEIKHSNIYAVVENIQEIVWAVDKDFRLLVCNSKFVTIAGKACRTKIATGINLLGACPPSFIAFWMGDIARAWEGDSFQSVKMTHDGVHIEISYRPIKYEAGTIEGVAFFAKDISEDVKQRTQIRLNANEIKKLNQEMDKFVYSASHDLKNPVSSLLGLINNAKKENDISPTALEYFEMMGNSVNKMELYIRDLINFGSNLRKAVKKEAVVFERVLEEVLLRVSEIENYEAVQKKINIKQKGIFISDHERIAVILEGVISNSIVFMDSEKNHPFVDIDIKVVDGKARIQISDNGEGIEHTHLQEVFNMYYRASRNGLGHGLGLFIVQETVHKLGGEVFIDSVIKQKTVVVIELPSLDKPLEQKAFA